MELREGRENEPDTGPRCRGEAGAALVEFSLVVGLLMLFLYGIIAFGMVLAVKESVTQAAADGARAAVPAANTTAATAAALAAANNAISWLGQCNNGSFTCTPTVTPAGSPGCTGSATSCITVAVSYDWKDHAVVPNLPGLGLILPDTIPSQATSELAHA